MQIWLTFQARSHWVYTIDRFDFTSAHFSRETPLRALTFALLVRSQRKTNATVYRIGFSLWPGTAESTSDVFPIKAWGNKGKRKKSAPPTPISWKLNILGMKADSLWFSFFIPQEKSRVKTETRRRKNNLFFLMLDFYQLGWHETGTKINWYGILAVETIQALSRANRKSS